MSDKALFHLCAAEDIQENEAKRVVLPSNDAVAVCRLGDGYYALDDLCTHGLASLCDGEVEDEQIFCPFHGGAFDIRTGKPTERPCTVAVKTYEVIQKEGQLYIEAP